MAVESTLTRLLEESGWCRGDLTRSIVAEEEGVIGSLYEYIRGAYPA